VRPYRRHWLRLSAHPGRVQPVPGRAGCTITRILRVIRCYALTVVESRTRARLTSLSADRDGLGRGPWMFILEDYDHARARISASTEIAGCVRL
jgi:hypothetical protein